MSHIWLSGVVYTDIQNITYTNMLHFEVYFGYSVHSARAKAFLRSSISTSLACHYTCANVCMCVCCSVLQCVSYICIVTDMKEYFDVFGLPLYVHTYTHSRACVYSDVFGLPLWCHYTSTIRAWATIRPLYAREPLYVHYTCIVAHAPWYKYEWVLWHAQMSNVTHIDSGRATIRARMCVRVRVCVCVCMCTCVCVCVCVRVYVCVCGGREGVKGWVFDFDDFCLPLYVRECVCVCVLQCVAVCCSMFHIYV